MVSVRGSAVSGQFRQDRRAALLRVLQTLQHQDGGALRANEAVAVLVEGAACFRRLVVARGKGPHHAEGGESQFADAGLGAAGEHYIGPAVPNDLHRLADRLRRSGAGRDIRVVVPLQTEMKRDLSRRHIRQHLQDVERIDSHAAAVHERAHGVLGVGKAAVAVAEEDPGAGAVFIVEAEAGAFNRLASGGDGELREAGHAPRFLVVNVVGGFEALHFSVDVHRVAATVELRDGTTPERPSTHPCQKSLTVSPRGVMAPIPVITTRRPVFSLMLSSCLPARIQAPARLLRFYR